ncbi:MAG: hypothetical protein MZW92_77975 [Comamonadaceae bacterium]|nr:hypothetical protein [Comamonadaceae bacterium]
MLRIGATIGLPAVLQEPRSRSGTASGRGRAGARAVRQPGQPAFLRRAWPPAGTLCREDGLPAPRTAGRPARQPAVTRPRGFARQVLPRRRDSTAQPGSLLPPSRPGCESDAHRGRPACLLRLPDCSAGDQGDGPGGRRRPCRDAQHHAVPVRTGLETQPGHPCSPQAGQRRAVPPVLPCSAALRRRTERPRVSWPSG